MNIVLTSKDADSIIRWFREELEGVANLQENINRGFKNLCSIYKNSETLKSSEKCTDEIGETEKVVNKRLTEIENDRLQLLHFIEILTCGSEGAK